MWHNISQLFGVFLQHATSIPTSGMSPKTEQSSIYHYFWWDSTKDICLLFLEAAKDLEVSMQPVDRMPPPESSSGGPGARELPWASCVCPKLAVTSSLIPWMTQWNCQMGNQSPQPFLRQSSGRASSRFVTSAWMPTRNHSSSLANGQSLFKGCLLFGMHPLN